jgi:protoporphyrinogen oxidase
VLVPKVPLGELYDNRIADWLRAREVTIHLETSVERITGDADRATGIQLAAGEEQSFDHTILAVPWRRAAGMLPPNLLDRAPALAQCQSLASAPITAVHLWLDQQITDLPHAVLVGRLSQWVFARSAGRGAPGPDRPGEHYYQVVISGSHELAGRDRQSVIEEVLADLRAVFPAARTARLLRSKLITEPDAVFSARPGLDRVRPGAESGIERLLLAGDWTGTGWPATMEGAIRSGYLAAEALLARIGRPQPLVVPDLPRGWLVKLLVAR